MLINVAQRLDLPALPVRLKYDPETDTLYLWFREDLKANRTTDDLENGLYTITTTARWSASKCSTLRRFWLHN